MKYLICSSKYVGTTYPGTLDLSKDMYVGSIIFTHFLANFVDYAFVPSITNQDMFVVLTKSISALAY